MAGNNAGGSYRTELVVVTPKLAAKMLSHNYEGNRPIRKSYVSQLAEAMSEDRFISQNGQTIVLGAEDGVLYDGQHRLSAIVESGTTHVFMVAYVPDGANRYKTIDGGTKRNASDFVDLPDKNNAAAIARRLAAMELGDAPLLSCLQGRLHAKVQVDNYLTILYCEEHKDGVMQAANAARRLRYEVGCGSISTYGLFYGLVSFIGNDYLLPELIDDFCSLTPSSPTTAALKSLISRSYMQRSKPTNAWLLGTLLDGYTHFLACDDSTTLNKQTYRLNEYDRYMQDERASRSAEVS